MLSQLGYDNLRQIEIHGIVQLMKKLIILIAFLLTTSAYAFEQPVVREETTPPPASGPITLEQIPALNTGAKPMAKPGSPTTAAPINRAENEGLPIIGDEDLASG